MTNAQPSLEVLPKLARFDVMLLATFLQQHDASQDMMHVLERLVDGYADVIRDRQHDETGLYEHAHEDVIPEPASPARTRHRLQQLVAIVGAYRRDDSHTAHELRAAVEPLATEIGPLLDKVEAEASEFAEKARSR